MKTNFYLKLSIQIVLIFTALIFASFIGDYLHEFLGDTYCMLKDCHSGMMGESHVTPEWHWGYRHWLLFFMGASLFISQFVRICNLISDERL